mmetsp:Transcript_45689/g.83678  ORF Transcript_45689/g.83678 Transcript_45689/m.83678 type:complete len:200 (+) Transcript_45689:134-733(+)
MLLPLIAWMAEPNEHDVARLCPPMAHCMGIRVIEEYCLPFNPKYLLIANTHSRLERLRSNDRQVRRKPWTVAIVWLQMCPWVELHIVDVHELAIHDLWPRFDEPASLWSQLAEQVVPVAVSDNAHCLPLAMVGEVLTRGVYSLQLLVNVPGIVEDRLQLSLEDGMSLFEERSHGQAGSFPDRPRWLAWEYVGIEVDLQW